MRSTRLTLTSAIYDLKERLHNEGFSTETSITGFPYVKVCTKDTAYDPWRVPCIVVYNSAAFDHVLQIGGGYWNSWLLHYDIFAPTEGGLHELVDIIWEAVRPNLHVYRYDIKKPGYQVLDGLIRTSYTSGAPALVTDAQLTNRAVTFMPRQDTIGEATAHAAQITVEVTSSTD